MERDRFTSFDILKVNGVTKERLRDWLDRGYVEPTTPAPGQGKPAIFTRADLYVIALFKHLTDDRKMTREEASKFSKGWRLWLEKYFKGDYRASQIFGRELILVISEDKLGFVPFSYLGESDKRLDRLIAEAKKTVSENHWTDIIIVNFARIREKIDNEITKLK